MKNRIGKILMSALRLLSVIFVMSFVAPPDAHCAQTTYSIWSAAAAPVVPDSGPDSAVELGVKFRSDVNGFVTGVRFYKAATNTGTHVGNLWTSTGTLLATAIFSSETASGWQQANFTTSVAVTANTVYVASYHTNVGHYSDGQSYFASGGVDNPPLHALADGISGTNGVYAYGTSSKFPTLGWKSTNYWVDVAFSADTTPPAISAFTVPSTAGTLTIPISELTATDESGVTGYLVTESAAVPSATASGWSVTVPVSYTFSTAGSKTLYAWAKDALGNVSTGVSASVEISLSDTTAPTITSFTLPAVYASLTVPISSCSASDNIGVTGYLITETSAVPSATVSGWSAVPPASYSFMLAGNKILYAWAKDAANNVSVSVSAPVSITASVVYSIWSATAVPGVTDAGPDSAVELGVKFRAEVSGTINGIRFYKTAANTGTHVGNLWTSTGTLLATATFTNETASGWQQVNFTTPVTISANTVYVASYHTNVGHYSDGQSFFASGGVDNPPLHALAEGVSGSNGVYAYGSASKFPGLSWKSTNYWVDVAFSADTTPPTVTSFTVPGLYASLTVPISTFTASDNIGVTGYLITETSTAPSAAASGWSVTAPGSYLFSTEGSKALYAWAKDSVGNVSSSISASTVITLPDTTPPTITAFTVPGRYDSLIVPISTCTASDNFGVTGYLITETSTAPSATASGWSVTVPTSYTFSTAGSKTLYAWAKDAVGNVSTGMSASIVIAPSDTSAPTITSFTVPAAYDSLAVPISTFDASDDTGVTGYLITETSAAPSASAGGWSATAPGSYTFATEGSKTLYAWARDAVGNVSSGMSASIVITLPDTTAPTITSFSVPPLSASLTVPISTFAVSDNIGVTGYLLAETSAVPSATASGWSVTAPATYLFATEGSKTLYAWARDAAGNVSSGMSAATVITLPDTTPPTITSFAVPAESASLTVPISSFTVSDNIGVTGYLITETSAVPSASASGWSAVPPSSYSAALPGSKILYAWAKDSAGNVSAGVSAPVSVTASVSFSVWPATAVPAVTDSGADSAVELGVKFRADLNGSIKGIRFYKASTNTGTHVGHLWSSTGTLLATATFSGESASGWQQANFTTPVAILANTVYVASYHTNVGHYSNGQYFFTSNGVDNSPLHALKSGVSGLNGVYAYGSSSVFPSQGWRDSNYWVDVAYSVDAPPSVTAFTIPSATTSLIVPISTLTATDDIGVTGYLITESPAAPSATAGGWSMAVPAAYYCATPGVKTLYAWAKDASGTVSASRSASVVISLGDTQPPVVTAFSIPSAATTLTVPITAMTATDNVAVTGYLVTESSAIPSLTAAAWLSAPPASYTFATEGNKNLYVWARDAAGNVSAGWSAAVTITLPNGTPVLIITSTLNHFTGYYAEILRAEGLNLFSVKDISTVTSAVLTAYDVVILGEMTLTADQAALFGSWVEAGGQLIAMRPDKKLAPLLGLTDLSSTLSNGYLLVNTSSGPGVGIVSQTMQYHGTADIYSLTDAANLATLYSTASSATTRPAVTLRNVGARGGQAAAFTYDLARSVIYTRQGNPAWSGQERDGYQPIRSDDLFFGNAASSPGPDWVDLNKVAIPQADEQQRLLANLIIRMGYSKNPLPRFWYLPRSLPAVVVMTGDDHGGGGTGGRFDHYEAVSPSGCTLDNWECIRGTSYIFAAATLTNAQALAYTNDGFEVALHPNTNCADWTPATLNGFYVSQLSDWHTKYSSIPLPVTSRTHCVVWSDYASQPVVELSNGIRLDTTYYYWPASWVGNLPGFFTGSGMPMRFADLSGNTIDVYQATTQMTDESGQSYPFTIDTLLDRAIGAEGYYGAFVANMHTDAVTSSESDYIVNSALARGIPVVSARQLLEWTDGRNNAAFTALDWNSTTLSFNITAGTGTTGLMAMAPVPTGRTVTRITFDGGSIPFELKIVKGLQYAVFNATKGSYQVTYTPPPDVTAPVTSITSPVAGATSADTVTVSAVAVDDIGVSSVEFYLDGIFQASTVTAPYVWVWDTTQVSDGTHILAVKAHDAAGNVGTGSAVSVTVSNSVVSTALVQSASSITSSAQSLSVTLPATVTTGNLIVVSVSDFPNLPGSPPVTDSLGNTYTIAGTILTAQGAYSAIYYAYNVIGGANVVTLFRTVSSGGQMSMAVAEFSGVATVSPLVTAVAATGSGSAPASGDMFPASVGDLVIGSGTHNGSTVTSAGPGFTMIAIPTEDSVSHQPLAVEYRIASGTEPVSATFSLAAGCSWIQNGALFRHR